MTTLDASAPYAVDVAPRVIAAGDGYSLAGTIFRPAGRALAAAAVFNTGAGISAKYYRLFAHYLAQNGVGVLTYDYRGVGASRPLRLRGFKATIEDWCDYDSAAAISTARAEFPGLPVVGVAHSVGALLMLCSAATVHLDRLLLVAPHTGHFRDYHPRYRWPMALMWHGVMPVLTNIVGFFPGRALCLGDDIPAGVALQWSARRRGDLEANTRGDTSRSAALLRNARQLSLPALAITATDDAFATPAGAERLFRYTPGMAPEIRNISAADVALPRLGHFGFFRQSGRLQLWPWMLAYIVQGNARRAAFASGAALRDEGKEQGGAH